MATVKLPFQNPHVTLQNEVLHIDYRSKKLKLEVDSIRKIYLSKRKTGYLSAIFDNLFLMRSTNFKLFIYTDAEKPFILEIPAEEKQYFVNLISWVRKRLKTNEDIRRMREAAAHEERLRSEIVAA